jgi:Putative beta barrel porin-7 (BBP7)
MRKQILCALAVSFLSATSGFAQVGAPPPVFPAQALPPPGPYPPPGGPAPYPPPADFVAPPPSGAVLVDAPRHATTEPYRVWAQVEFLLWWVKDTPMPVPLVSGVDINGNPQTLFGQSNTGFGVFSGMRFGLGAWFDTNNTIGMDANMWFLERRSNNFFITSDGNGNPPLAVPFFNQTPGNTGEFVLPLATPGVSSGNVVIDSRLQLWGTEFNGALCLARTPSLEFTLLAGFRYLDLRETLYISNMTTDLGTDTTTVFNDSFNTRNQFYGGQLGTRVSWHGERLSLDLAAKVALGATSQTVDIQGSTGQFGPGFGGVSPGGFFAQPSNIGRYSATEFSVIPAAEFKLGYQLSRSTRFFIGYDFIYWNQVVRPGNQIDRNINITQASNLGGSGTLSGPAFPTPLFNRSDFWAQGVTLGFEFRF